MSSPLKRMIKKSKLELDNMVEESDLNNSDCFITALLGLRPEEAISIPNNKIQKVLNEEGIYTQLDLLGLTSKETWGEDTESAEKLERIKKKIIALEKGD